MPTPQGPRSAQAYDGVVPNMTWAQFVQSFSPSSMAFGSGDNGSTANFELGNLPGYGGAVRALQEGPQSDQFGNLIGGSSGQYGDYATNNLGDGTVNQFTEGPNGELVSKNVTQDSDSWWDSTGLPLVASLVTGGAAGLAGAAGAGASSLGTAGDVLGLSASDAIPEGATFGGTGALDVGAGFNPSDFSGIQNIGAEAGVGNDLGGVATTGAGGSGNAFLDSLTNGYNTVSNAYGSIDPLTRLGIGSLGSTALSDLSSGGGGDTGASGGSSSPSFSDAGYSAANGFDYNGGLSGASNTSTAGGLLSDGSNLLKSLGFSSTNPYASLLGSIASGVLGYNSANTAAGQQTSAINNANALTAAIYGDTVNRNAPFVNAGTGANNQLGNLAGLNGTGAQNTAFGQFQTSPNYQFAYSQGMKGIGDAASASGLVGSGRYLKDAGTFASGLGSQQYNAYTGQLSDLANRGESAANNTAQIGSNYANTAAGLTTAAGQAQSAGTIGSTDAITGAISSALNGNSQNQLLQLLLKNQGSNGFYSTPSQ